MTEAEIKRKVRSFCKEYALSEISSRSLKAIVEKQGYTIVEYNQVVNDGDVEKLIRSLCLSDTVLHTKGFTYADAHCRCVFLHEDLSEQEQCIVLAHELGHIYLNHLSNASVIGNDVREEYEANEFAHFLLHPTGRRKLSASFGKHKRAYIAGLVAALCVCAGIITLSVIHTQAQYYGEFYITATGNKYHKSDCIFVKNKSNVQRLTKEQFESGEYDPCEMCLPNE